MHAGWQLRLQDRTQTRKPLTSQMVAGWHCSDRAHLGPMPNVLVWFDGACPLCRREIALMRWLDRRNSIALVDVSQTATLDGASCPIDQSALLARFHALENGQAVSGAAAFAAMWRAIPLLRPLGLAARNASVLAGLEWLYGLFLRARPRLQRAAW